jgi:hypothetical protein
VAFDFICRAAANFIFCFYFCAERKFLFFEVSSFITCSGAVLFGFQVWQTFDTYGA